MSEQHTKRKARKRKTNKIVVAILSLLIVAAMSVCAVGAMKLIESMPKKKHRRAEHRLHRVG